MLNRHVFHYCVYAHAIALVNWALVRETIHVDEQRTYQVLSVLLLLGKRVPTLDFLTRQATSGRAGDSVSLVPLHWYHYTGNGLVVEQGTVFHWYHYTGNGLVVE